MLARCLYLFGLLVWLVRVVLASLLVSVAVGYVCLFSLWLFGVGGACGGPGLRFVRFASLLAVACAVRPDRPAAWASRSSGSCRPLCGLLCVFSAKIVQSKKSLDKCSQRVQITQCGQDVEV